MSGFYESKFKNVQATLAKREAWYEQLKLSSNANDNDGICTNSKFVAYIDQAGSGCAVGVLPLASVGKNHVPLLSPSYQFPLIRGHSSSITDIQFDRFNRTKILSCSVDSTCKLWDIPDAGYIVDNTTAVLSMEMGQPLKGIAQHPLCEGLVALRSSKEIALFDMATNKKLLVTSADTLKGAEIYSAQWSYRGDVLGATCKDKTLSLLDLRSAGSAALAASAPCHNSTKISRLCWLGDSPYLATVGHNSMQEREILLWDARNLSGGHVQRERLDASTGAIIPLFDPDASILVLAGKGDSSIRTYELGPAGKLLNSIVTPVGDAIRGAALAPKQSCDRLGAEVLRVLKQTDSAVQPIHFIVPRKEKKKFHEDLYPPSSYEAGPSMTIERWLAGEEGRPALVPLTADGAAGSAAAPLSSTSSEQREDATAAELGPSSSEKSSKASDRYASLQKYKNMYGVESPKNLTYYNLKPLTSTSDSAMIAASESYWAVPYQGGGGPVYASPHGAHGKVEPSCALINGHKAAVLDLSFSPFQPNVLATASADCSSRLWRLPADPSANPHLKVVSMGDGDALASLKGHNNSVRTIDFSPTIESLLCTTAADMSVRLWDVSVGKEVANIDLRLSEGSFVHNISFGYDGTLLSAAGRDKKVRLFDPRAPAASAVVATIESARNTLHRNTRALICSRGASSSCVLTTSSSDLGTRLLQLWDPRALNGAPFASHQIDNGSSMLYPMYDESSGVCFIAGRGDTNIRYFELLFLEGGSISCERANEFNSSEPINGLCLLPKRSCDVRKIEAARIYKLTNSSVVPLSFFVPRASTLKEYFQDDLYVPVRSATPAGTVHEWVGGKTTFDPAFESLKPADMPSLSDKPEEKVVRSRPTSVDFKKALDESEDRNRQAQQTLARFTELAMTTNKATKVDADLVEDSDSDRDWDD